MTDNRYEFIDTTYLNELSDNDEEFIKDIINDFLNIVPESLLELEKAVNNKSIKDINFYAHKLKGSFRFIGSNKIADILFEIEEAAKNESVYNYDEEIFKIKNLYKKAEAELEHFRLKI